MQYRRTPSPSPSPASVGFRWEPEQPRCAETVQSTQEPHQCSFGSDCIYQIESRMYHRIKAIHLNARAEQLSLPADGHKFEKSNIWFLRRSCASVSSMMIEWRKSDPNDVLREIQSPEYWEAEKSYLRSPGCLEERFKQYLLSSTETLPSGRSVTTVNHEPL